MDRDARVFEVQSHSMADEVLRASLEAKLGVDVGHGRLVEVDT